MIIFFLTIQKEISETKLFSISVDSTFDVSRKEQVSFIIRYTCQNTGNIFERLVALRESPCTTGFDLFELFKRFMNKLNLDWETNLVGQSFDGAANMRGEYQGLQSRIKEVNEQSVYIWCHAHRLNLIVQEAVSSSTYASDLFGNLETLYSFIWCSKKRVAVFQAFQEKKIKELGENSGRVLALKRVCSTRWSSHFTALHTILNTYDSVIDTLDEIRITEGPTDVKSSSMANGLLEYFSSKQFLFTAFVFKHIFNVLEPLNKSLQSRDIDFLAVSYLIEAAKVKIKNLNSRESNNNFNNIINEVDEFSNRYEVVFTPLSLQRKRRVPRMAGELRRDEPIEDPIKKFKINCFYSVLDIIQNQLCERFSDRSGLFKDLSLLSRNRIMEIRSNHKSLPKDAFLMICSVYKKYLHRENLISDYLQFADNYIEFVNTIDLPNVFHADENSFDSDNEILEEDDLNFNTDDEENNLNNKNIFSMLDLFKLFCNCKLQTVFPSLYTLLHISATLPVSSCSTERSFSKLKLVKTKLRTTMQEERLENLMLISCEADLTKNINTENVIHTFASKSSVLSKSLMF